MADGKSSFIAYADWKDTFDELTDEEAGKLMKHILAYVNDEDPETDDRVVRAAFAGIRTTLKRDLKKWEAKHQKRVESGRKGGLARAKKVKQNQAMLSNAKQIQANQAVSVSVSGSVSDSVYPSVDGYVSPATAAATILQDDEYMIATRLKSSTKFLKHVLTPNGTGKSPFETHCIQQGKALRTIDEYKAHLANWSGKRWSELSKASKDKWK